MTNFGTIKAYDSGNGNGTIAPEQGGEPLHFGKNDVQQRAAEPRQGQRYGYDTKQAGGGKVCSAAPELSTSAHITIPSQINAHMHMRSASACFRH